MVPANSRRIPRAPRYSGYRYQSNPYLYRLITFYGMTFQTSSSSDYSRISRSYYPDCRRNDAGLGSSAFARHYSRNHMLFSLPPGTKMFQFPGFAPALLVTGLQPAGLPHSDISGSKVVCTSPKLFAAYHVLLRLLEPRHPPFALILLSLCEIAYFALCMTCAQDVNAPPGTTFL